MTPKIDIKDKIEEGFLEVLKKTTFKKCKVTEIVKAAGVSHQTFYRYYIDKYDLAFKLSVEKFSFFTLIYGNNAKWKDIVITMLHSFQNSPVMYKRLLEDVEGAELVLQSILKTSEVFSGKKASVPGIAGWIETFKEWSRSDFKTSVDDIYIKIRNNTSLADVLPDEEIDKLMSVYETRRLDFFRNNIK